MNALYFKDLAAKTHRGLRGRVEAGRSAGGRCYGYDVVQERDGAGDPVRGKRRINPDEAAIVRRIFAAYAAGKSPKKIALELNRAGVPGPDGGAWGPPPSTATARAAPASSTTSSLSAAWSGTGCATSRTRRPASASRGRTRPTS
ncbi:MAG: Resolvase domain protein [Rhodospirillales bacterium]|nr:Resolvase domain protein [Rhodospirillales bacterium]